MMAHITKIAAMEMTSAIWKYDPSLPDNHMLNGSLDVIAVIHTLVIKVCFVLFCFVLHFILFDSIRVVDEHFLYARFSHQVNELSCFINFRLSAK